MKAVANRIRRNTGGVSMKWIAREDRQVVDRRESGDADLFAPAGHAPATGGASATRCDPVRCVARTALAQLAYGRGMAAALRPRPCPRRCARRANARIM